VDEGSANVQTETQQPQNKQNNENSPKHVSLPADLSELNLMKPFISPTNVFTTESLISPISSLIRKARFGHASMARTGSRVSLLEADEIIVKPFKVGRLADLICEKTVWKRKELA
jgi:hypothetical protein